MDVVSVITGFAIPGLLIPVDGNQEYVNPAVGNEPTGALLPEQMDTLFPAFATGKGLVVTTTVSEFIQPFKVVFKMYVVDCGDPVPLVTVTG